MFAHLYDRLVEFLGAYTVRYRPQYQLDTLKVAKHGDWNMRAVEGPEEKEEEKEGEDKEEEEEGVIEEEDETCLHAEMRRHTDNWQLRRDADFLRSWLFEDDADSGYHTGSSTLQSHAQKKAPPGEWTLTREDLRHNIETFNNNNHGLIMSLAQHQDSNTFQGFIRVHMNLIRPINMSLSARPASIYDVIGQGSEEGEEQAGSDNAQTTSFYLPKDTTKVIHIQSDTTTQEVIRTLLSKFAITDNPRKFALYEKIVRDGGKKETMRRLDSDERPLPLCLSWTSDGINGLDIRRFVLQENDTGEIMWEAFSLPELENFLKILDREEDEYMEQVKEKYTLLKIQMERRLKELEPETTTMTAGDPETGADGEGDDKRVPVFV